MGLMDQLEKNKAAELVATPAQAVVPTIPGIAPALTQALVDSILAEAEVAKPALQQLAPEDRGAQIGPVTPGKVKFVIGAPKAPSPAPVAPSATVAANPVLQTGLATATVVAAAPIKQAATVADILNVEIHTFERGSEKYSKEEVESLQGALNLLVENIKDPKMVGQSIKNVMYSLAENPELKTIMKPENIGWMVRGLRESYGMHLAKRSDVVTAKVAKQGKQRAMDDAFADLEF